MTEIKNTSVIDFSDISDEQMNEMIDGTLTEFDEGDLVDGTVVKLEHDEVLVDIGFKSEGVIPARELSIRKDADPSDIVSLGDKIEALVLQKEDKDGRLILSKTVSYTHLDVYKRQTLCSISFSDIFLLLLCRLEVCKNPELDFVTKSRRFFVKATLPL